MTLAPREVANSGPSMSRTILGPSTGQHNVRFRKIILAPRGNDTRPGAEA